jgi:hypothetical protein
VVLVDGDVEDETDAAHQIIIFPPEILCLSRL